MKNNFLIVILADNDFGHSIKSVLNEHVDYITQDLENNLELIRNFVIAQVVRKKISSNIYNNDKKEIDWDDAQHIEQYLKRKMRFSFTEKLTLLNHESGSAYLDLNLKEAFYL